jgi:hypothetical protein
MLVSNTIKQHEPQDCHQRSSEILLERVIQEGITQSRQSAYQAHWSFLSAIALSTTSAFIGLSGASLMLLGHASEGSVTAAVGLVSGAYSHQLSKDAADRQRQANERLDHMLQELGTIKPPT